MKRYNIAIIGASGMVGRMFVQILEERNFPILNLYLFASSKSAGEIITYKDKEYIVEELSESSLDRDIDIALFSAGSEVSKRIAPIAKRKGIIVIDNSSAWRMDGEVPLVVPEVNEQTLKYHRGIISNPNCSTIQAVVALKPLHERFHIKRVIYSTYQAVSGSGKKGLEDLEKGTTNVYKYPIQYNCIPHIDDFLDTGYTKEEMKMINETKKILGDEKLLITATTVRVPVKVGHSISVNIEFKKFFEIDEVINVLRNSCGIIVVDRKDDYPTPIDVEGKDAVYVGRIRRDYSLKNGINMWVVADNIRKGAATNTVQIAEALIKGGFHV